MGALSLLYGLFALAGATLANMVPLGVLEGHLRIAALKPVELAEGSAPAVTASTYREYPLAVLTSGKKEVARMIADDKGNYRISLPPGDYILDVQDRAHKHVRGQPKGFTVRSNETVHVDLEIDTGVR